MSYFSLKDSDVISTVYTAHPSYTFKISVSSDQGQSQEFYIFSSSQKQSRDYFDVNGDPVSSTYSISGSAVFVGRSQVSSTEKRAIGRLREMYESVAFKKPKNYFSSSIYANTSSLASQDMGFLDIPSVLFGTEIKPGSVVLNDTGTFKYTDDGYGGLYSGSELVGSVFYQHGLIYFDQQDSRKFSQTMALTCSISGTSKTPINLYNCRVPRGGLNFSTNPSYVTLLTSSNNSEVTTKNPKTFITSIGLYDENYKLVGVAKLANPILNEEATGILFRLKLNF